MDYEEHNERGEPKGNFLDVRCFNHECRQGEPLVSLGAGFQRRFMPQTCYDCQQQTMAVTCFIGSQDSRMLTIQYNCASCRGELRQEMQAMIIECDSCHEKFVVYH